MPKPYPVAKNWGFTSMKKAIATQLTAAALGAISTRAGMPTDRKVLKNMRVTCQH
jgi:hypothetical protein